MEEEEETELKKETENIDLKERESRDTIFLEKINLENE